MRAEFVSVTETPGSRASQEQLARLYQRYHLAARLSRDKDVLEAACGAGIGLGYVAQTARRVVGGDIDEHLLALAARQAAGRPNIEVLKFDAQDMPFPAESFDVVLLFEAIYYLPRPKAFVAEARRVLRPGGTLMIASVNKEWPDFNPSPHSVDYYTAAEMRALLEAEFRAVEVSGGFPVEKARRRDRWASLLKRGAVRLRLMPRTMKGKEALKRLFFGRLVPIPAAISEGGAECLAPVPLAGAGPWPTFKIIYYCARR